MACKLCLFSPIGLNKQREGGRGEREEGGSEGRRGEREEGERGKKGREEGSFVWEGALFVQSYRTEALSVL